MQVWLPAVPVETLHAHTCFEGHFAGSELLGTVQGIPPTHLWKLGSWLQCNTECKEWTLLSMLELDSNLKFGAENLVTWHKFVVLVVL